MRYPKTAAAIENAQFDQWAIADALLEEIGPHGDYHDGSTNRFKECEKELADQGHVGSHGKGWKADTLRRYRDVAAAFPSVKRLTDASWSVHYMAYEAGCPDLLPLLQSCVEGRRPKALLPPAVEQFSYQGSYEDLPTVIKRRGRVAVNDVMLATGQRRMHKGGGRKKTEPSNRIEAQAEQVEDLLSDPEVAEQVKADAVDLKRGRKMAAAVKAWEAEAEAARVEVEKEEQRVAAAARKNLGKSMDYWPELHRQIDAFTKLLATYFRDFDDLPPPEPYELRLLDGALKTLRGGIDRFDKKLHPGGTNRVRRGTVIDVTAN